MGTMDAGKHQDIFIAGSQVENKSRVSTSPSSQETTNRLRPPSSGARLYTNSPSPLPHPPPAPPGTPLPPFITTHLPLFTIPIPPSATPTPVQQQQSSAYDQDYEDISTILHRLQDSQHHFLLPSISICCRCPDSDRATPPVTKASPNSGHSKHSEPLLFSSSEDESDSEEDSFKLAQLFRAFALYEKKSHNKQPQGGSLGALRNLVHSYHSREDIGDAETSQVLELLDHGIPGLQEMALLTMNQLCVRENNAFKFLFHDTVPKLLLILELETTASLHEATAFALEQILSHRALKDWWLEQMKMGGFASVLNHLSPDYPLPVRYACGCVLKSLAQTQLFAGLIVQQAMDIVGVFKTMNSDFQELYTEIISKLLVSADRDTTSLLSIDALPASVSMLQRGPCGPQQQSLHLIGALADTPAGMEAILDGKVIPLVVSALVNTDCRKVREKAAQTMVTLSNKVDPEIQREFLLHVDEFYHHQEDQLDQALEEEEVQGRVLSRGGGANGKGGGANGKGGGPTKKEKMERALEAFGKDLVRLFQKQGRMEKDLHGDIVDVHLAPGIDVNPTNLNTICHLLTIMRNLVTLSVCQVKVDLSEFKEQFPAEVRQVRSRTLPVNHKVLQVLIKTKALTIVDLLSVYTQKLLDVISNQNKKKEMAAVSTNQILFQAWDSQSAVMSKTGTLYLRSILDELEIKVITCLLETLTMMSKCAASCRSTLDSEEDTLETRVQDKIERRQSAGESVARQDSKVSKKSKKKQALFHSKLHCQLCNKKVGTVTAQPPGMKSESASCGKPPTGRPRSPVKELCDCSESNVNLDKVEKCYREGLKKELGVMCRDIRVALFECGLIESVGPWLLSADAKHQELVLGILHNMIQPLDERIVPRSPKDVKPKFDLTKPASQMCQKERDHAMSIALYQMSSRMRSFIEDALTKTTEATEQTPLPVPITVVKQTYDKFARSATSTSDSRPPCGKSSDRARSPRRRGGCNRVGSRPHSATAKSGLNTRPSSAARTGKGESVTDKDGRRRPATAKDRAMSQPRTEVMTESGLVKSDSTPLLTVDSASRTEQLHSASLGYVSVDSGISSGFRSRSSLGGHRCKSPLDNKRPSTPARSKPDIEIVGEFSVTPGQKAFRRMWVPWKPQLDFTQPLGEQCRCLVALVVGKVLLQQLFAKGSECRTKALNFIDQYIQHGQVSSHLKMSEMGIIPKMVDFLRVNDDNQVLEIMGLSVVQSLVKSDDRLKELFQRHGGTQLLMAMTSCSTGVLKEEVTDTLKVISKSSSSGSKSVKKSKQTSTSKPQKQSDIWDEIMQRWKQEDKVTAVLQNFAQG